MASPVLISPVKPRRAVIFWRTIVAMMENTMAHASANPKYAPVVVAVVTVPGPMNEALISRPGPIQPDFFFVQ